MAGAEREFVTKNRQGGAMKRLMYWLGIATGTLAVIAATAYVVVYVVSERELRRTYPMPTTTSVALPTDPAALAEGQRLATILGCFKGCHGRQAEGSVFFDEPMIARIVAPNLTASVRNYSDAELAVAIRQGLRPDGRSMVVMPSESFVALTDEDLGRIIAFLRSVPPVEGPGRDLSPGPLGRIGFAMGEFQTTARLVAESVAPPAARSDNAVHGRYLAQIACAHCHGADLRGSSNPDFTSPNLGVVAAYSSEQFTALLRTGVAIGGRTLGVMSPYARKNLSQLNDSEIAALYEYLHALPAS
jgi:cytochrome c553